MALTFNKSGRELVGFADADWGNFNVDRRSYSGYLFILAGGAVTWEARKQRTVALSSTEAEHLCLSEAAKEGIHLKRFLQELGVKMKTPIVIYDSQGAQRLVQNPIVSRRTKHIDIRHHFIQGAVEDGDIKINHRSNSDMVADYLILFHTKAYR